MIPDPIPDPFFALFLICSVRLSADAIPPIPDLNLWEKHMVEFGEKSGHEYTYTPDTMNEQDVWHYDGERVYYQIADYTKDPKRNKYAQYCEAAYRDSAGTLITCDGKALELRAASASGCKSESRRSVVWHLRPAAPGQGSP